MALKNRLRNRGAKHPPVQLPAEPGEVSNKLDKVTISDGGNVKSQTLLLGLRHRFVSSVTSHKQIAVPGVVVLVLGVAGLVLLLSRPDPKPVAKPAACSHQVLEAAKPNLTFKNVDKLETQVKQIEATAYKTDAECIYVVLTYNIYKSNAQKARELYDALVAVYDPVDGYETVYVDVAQPPEKLKPQVEFLEKQAEMTAQIGERYKGPKIDPATGAPIR